MPDMTVDVVSDAVCPWCFVGKRRLEAALAESAGADVSVQWRPFQLDPTIPAEGLDREAYMRAKFRDDARLAEVHQRLKALGAEVGISFDFAAIKRSPNTLDAHRLIRWAGEAGVQDAVVERLFSAYFARGEDIGDRDALVRIAQESGMSGEDVKRRLADEADAAEVKAEIERAQQLGVSGVPFFIFANKLAVSGAQSAEVLARAMKEAAKTGGGVAVA
jgi:predicted DsbA family dithiol-disulfide isomerase